MKTFNFSEVIQFIREQPPEKRVDYGNALYPGIDQNCPSCVMAQFFEAKLFPDIFSRVSTMGQHVVNEKNEKIAEVIDFPVHARELHGYGFTLNGITIEDSSMNYGYLKTFGEIEEHLRNLP